MKAALFVLLFAVSSVAQVPSSGPTRACGPQNVSFKVTLEDTLQPLAPVAPGKARIYFIHDAGSISHFNFAYPTTKFAIDGAWAGANHGDSWFAATVDPGEHHVCATLQSSIVDDRVELAHFQAEPGKIYYFRTRLVMSGQVELLELDSIDSDQGRFLIGIYPLSVFHPRK